MENIGVKNYLVNLTKGGHAALIGLCVSASLCLIAVTYKKFMEADHVGDERHYNAEGYQK
jgi:hypothetical protein